MVVPKRSDRLMQHLMNSNKTQYSKPYNNSEESEYNTLKYDIDKGMKLPEHKMKRFLELKIKLGK